MTDLLSLPDLPADQVGSAQVLAAAAGSGGSVAYKVALASYVTAAGAAGTYAPLTGPSFRGIPTAPTAASGTNSTQLATTAFVAGAVAGITAAALPANPPASPATLTSDDVTRALGFAPYSAANPAGYQTAATVTATLGAYLTSASAVSTYQPRLGFTPYDAANPSGYQTAAQVTSAISGHATISYVDSRVTALINAAPAALDTLGKIATQLASDENAAAALTIAVAGKVSATTAAATYLTMAGAATLYQPAIGYTAYDAANPAGYQTAANVAAGLAAYVTSAGAAATYQPLIGFTPYNSTNPAGYIPASGAPVQSVAGRMGAVVLAVADVSGAYASSNPAGYQTAGQVNAALSGYATTNYVDGRVAALINAAPTALDTLGEIAAQLASDESAAAALTTAVAGKLAKASNLSDLASLPTARTNLGLGGAAVLNVGTAAGTVADGGVVAANTANIATNTSNISTLQTSLSGYVTSGGLTTALAPYALTTTLSGYVTSGALTTALSSYALSNGVPTASSTFPSMDGTAAVGSGATFARADHVHPSDTTRQTAAQVSSAITTALLPYATSASLSSYVLTSTLAGYVTTGGLTSALAPYALTSALPAAYSLPVASASVLGGVKAGSGVTIAGDGTLSATGPSGVTTFNTRSGAVTLTLGDVTGLLGAGLPVAQGGTGATTVAGALTALGAYAAANPAGFQTAANVTTTLGAYLTTATAASTYQTALGFTPYNAANPAGYIAASGAPVQSVAGRTGAVVLAVGDVSGAQSAGQVSAAITAAITGYATTSYVDGRVASLINAAPAALDTLGEIATQLASDESAAAALTTTVSGKLSISTAASTYLTIANAASTYQTASQVSAAVSSGTAVNVSGTVALANGGTGATTAVGARTALGLATVAATGAYADLSGAPAAYTLPTASTTVLGGVKVDGTTVTIAGGVISSVGGGTSTVPVATVSASGASQTLAAATSGSKAYDITLTANCTLTLSGGTAGQQQTITAYLRQDATAGRVVTLPTGVRWPGGVAPTPNTSAGVIDVFVFTTPDAGTTWFGSY